MFKSYQGVRQGNPISPSLFIIALEIFSRTYEAQVVQGVIKPFSCKYKARPGTHLLFADDMVLFTNGGSQSIRKIMKILDWFCISSGQMINQEKSVIFFSKTISAQRRHRILHMTQFQAGTCPVNYLGAPLFVGRSRANYFDDIVAKVRKRISGWYGKSLSMGGKLALINSVLNSIPIHTLSVIPAPKTIINKLQRLLANFLWDSGEQKRCHWAAWDKICKPITDGGLGIRSLHDVTSALQAKLAWSFIQQSSTWSKFMAAKYGRPFDQNVKRTGSAVWLAIKKFLPNLIQQAKWIIGRGDVKLGELYSNIVMPTRLKGLTIRYVLHNGDVLDQLPNDLANEIRLLPPEAIKDSSSDVVIWKPDPHGIFSTGSFLKNRDQAQGQVHHKKIWFPWLPTKISIFMWRVLRGAVPLDKCITRRGFSLASKCVCCAKASEENIDHLFMHSDAARPVWGYFAAVLGLPKVTTVYQLYAQWIRTAKTKSQLGFCTIIVACCTIWEVWCYRNKVIHEEQANPQHIMQKVRAWLHKLQHLFRPQLKNQYTDVLSLNTLHIPPAAVMSKSLWVRWEPHGSGNTLNTDGSARLGQHTGGGVVRDSSGKVLCAFTACYGQGTNTLAELRAVIDGLVVAASLGVEVHHVQIDSKIIVQCITGDLEPPWECTYLIRKAQQLIGHRSIHHVFREANQVADRLADVAYAMGNFQSQYLCDFPSSVRSVVLQDAQGLPFLRDG